LVRDVRALDEALAAAGEPDEVDTSIHDRWPLLRGRKTHPWPTRTFLPIKWADVDIAVFFGGACVVLDEFRVRLWTAVGPFGIRHIACWTFAAARLGIPFKRLVARLPLPAGRNITFTAADPLPVTADDFMKVRIAGGGRVFRATGVLGHAHPGITLPFFRAALTFTNARLAVQALTLIVAALARQRARGCAATL
jgi:hypothetical protein